MTDFNFTYFNIHNMKYLRISIATTAVLGSLSVLSLVSLLLALSDIAKQTEDLTLKWYVSGISIIILGLFTVSTFVTILFILRYLDEGNRMICKEN